MIEKSVISSKPALFRFLTTKFRTWSPTETILLIWSIQFKFADKWSLEHRSFRDDKSLLSKPFWLLRKCQQVHTNNVMLSFGAPEIKTTSFDRALRTDVKQLPSSLCSPSMPRTIQFVQTFLARKPGLWNLLPQSFKPHIF